jgi:hypothetical protein
LWLRHHSPQDKNSNKFFFVCIYTGPKTPFLEAKNFFKNCLVAFGIWYYFSKKSKGSTTYQIRGLPIYLIYLLHPFIHTLKKGDYFFHKRYSTNWVVCRGGGGWGVHFLKKISHIKALDSRY